MNWKQVKTFLMKYDIPQEVINRLPDIVCTAIYRRLTLNISVFDDYLHSKYGEYEKEGKTMSDLMKEIFKDDYPIAMSLF